jgi:DNA-binding transcriptional LysR family regulator
MRLEDLSYLIRVAESGSISQAAENCYISQQGLSRIISSLERELGVQLFCRQGNHIRLTNVGEVVVSWAKELDAMHMQMLRDISRASTEEMGCPPVDYHIYTTHIISSTVLSKILSALNLRYPGVNLDVEEAMPPVIANELEFDERTIGIISLTTFHEEESLRLRSGELRFDHYFQDELMIGVAEHSALSAHSQFSSAELATIPMALCHTEAMMFQNMLEDGDAPTIALHISSYDLCREMVRRGRAAGLTSRLREHYTAQPLKAIPVEKKIYTSYGCIYDPRMPQAPFIQELIALVRKELSGLNNR